MRSRISVYITVAALAGTLALHGCATGASSPDAPPPTVGQPVVLDASVPHWTTSAWLAKDALCVRVARFGGERTTDRENELLFCDSVSPALNASGPPLLPAKPQPYVAP